MGAFETIQFDLSRLCPGAQEETIHRVEKELGVILPECLKEFLRFADGGFVGNFILYSAGDGIHPVERLIPANLSNGPDCPVFVIGREASDDFGFLRHPDGSFSPEVYFLSHETGERIRAAPTLQDFLGRIALLRPGEGLRVDEKKRL